MTTSQAVRFMYANLLRPVSACEVLCFENWGLYPYQSSSFAPAIFVYIGENEKFWKLQSEAASRAE